MEKLDFLYVIELKILSDSFDKMIERLEISFKKQNQFILEVSHELKTSISVISGYMACVNDAEIKIESELGNGSNFIIVIFKEYMEKIN